MDRTLYLCENTRGIQVLRDGPSIWVKEPDRAGYRVPARMISRLVIIGDIVLDTGVITLFSETGAPVVFLSRLSDEITVTMPTRGNLPAHYLRQKTALRSRTVRDRFSRWAQVQRVGIQRRVAQSLYHFLGRGIRMGMGENDYHELVSYLRPSDDLKWTSVTGFVGSLFMGVIIEQLCGAGLDPHPGILRGGERYGLAADIRDIMEAEIDLQALQFLKCSVEHPPRDRKYQSSRLTEQAVKNIVQHFENRRLATEREVAALVEDCVRLMGGGI